MKQTFYGIMTVYNPYDTRQGNGITGWVTNEEESPRI